MQCTDENKGYPTAKVCENDYCEFYDSFSGSYFLSLTAVFEQDFVGFLEDLDDIKAIRKYESDINVKQAKLMDRTAQTYCFCGSLALTNYLKRQTPSLS